MTMEKMRLECRITRQECRYTPVIFNTFLFARQQWLRARMHIIRTLPVMSVPQTGKKNVHLHSSTQHTAGADAVTCKVARVWGWGAVK